MMNLFADVFMFFAMIVLLLVVLEIVSTGAVEAYSRIQKLKQWWGGQ